LRLLWKKTDDVVSELLGKKTEPTLRDDYR
jgi:hypothetical protein